MDANDLSAFPYARMNILIVDDQPDGLLALEAILGDLQQNLVRASSGREALRLLLKQDYALILLDVVMPGMDGFETAQLIRARERTRHTPIIFLTAARKGEGPLSRGYETGAVDFIYKPIDPEVLRSKVRVFVELARKTEEIRRQTDELRAAERREHERDLASAQERARAEQLHKQQQWTEALLDGLPRALLLANPETGAITFANRAGQRFAQALEMNEGSFSAANSPLRRAARGERLENVLLDWELAGEAGALLVTSERLPAMHGRPETAIISALDVTDLKRTEDKLQRAVRARDEFMSAASHELNTPLTTIVLQLDSLTRQVKKAGLEDDARIQKTTATMGRNVDRLGRLISELLDVSRIGEGKLKLDVSDVDLAELARDVASRFEEQMARVGCKLELSVGGPVVGRWDRSRLDQVITNLLTNAMKYAPGKPVEVTVAGDDAMGRFTIRDHGIGIAKEHHARVFERFERAVPSENYAGLGLGLWIVSRIVQDMGGNIALQSELGEGATFIVELPIASASRTEELPAGPETVSMGPLPSVAAGMPAETLTPASAQAAQEVVS